MVKQSKGLRWYTCIFADKSIVQRTVPTHEGIETAKRWAESEWCFNRARSIMEKEHPGFTVKPQVVPDPSYDKLFTKYINIVKTLKAPQIRLFQWEDKKGSSHS